MNSASEPLTSRNVLHLPTGVRRRALVYCAGATDGMQFVVTDTPQVGSIPKGDDELLIQVRAVALNPVDYKLPLLVPFAWFFLRGLPVCQDFAGVVVSAPPSSSFPVGTRVFGTCEGTRGGCASDFISVRASNVAVIPPSLSFAHAASLNTVAQTAIQAFRRGGLSAGGRVLIIGASGGCGTAGIQCARAIVGPTGFVAGVCSGGSAKLVRELGTDATFDYHNEEIMAALKAVEPFDVIYDTVSSGGEKGDDFHGIPYATAFRPFLKEKRGCIVAINGTVLQWLGAIFCDTILQRRCCSSSGRNGHGGGYALIMQNHSSKDLNLIRTWAEDKQLRAIIDGVFPFTAEGCANAFARVKSRRAKGKVVLMLGADNE